MRLSNNLGGKEFLKLMLKRFAKMYESPSLQIFRTTPRIQSPTDALQK